MAVPTWRLRWLLGRMVDLRFHCAIWRTLRHPLRYYYALFVKFIPNRHNAPIEIALKDGKRFVIRSWSSGFIFWEIFVDRVYDVMKQTPRRVIDIGANTGLFVLRAKQLWPEVSVVAFEPEPNNYQALCETIRINALDKVEAVNAAITDQDGSITLYRHPRNIGAHSTVHHCSGDEIVVPSFRLDRFINSQPDKSCDLLKVDCEGGELAIFSALDQATANAIATIVYEPDEAAYDVQAMNNRLASLGFSISSSGNCFVARRQA